MKREAAQLFDKAEHDHFNPAHSGAHGHFCQDWDYMFICDDCHERDGCTCQHVVPSAAASPQGSKE